MDARQQETRACGDNENGHADGRNLPDCNHRRYAYWLDQLGYLPGGTERLVYMAGQTPNEFEGCFLYNGRYYAPPVEEPFFCPEEIIAYFAKNLRWLIGTTKDTGEKVYCDAPGLGAASP